MKKELIDSAIETMVFIDTYGPCDDEDIIAYEQAKDVLVTLGIHIETVLAKRKERMQRNLCTDPLTIRLRLANKRFVAVESDDLPF